jgi:hypothetical protein
MAYTVIDGHISDFIESMIELTNEFRTDELRQFLLNEGHAEKDVLAGIQAWQKERFQCLDPMWERFVLTPAGSAGLGQLRDRVD